MVLQQSQRLAAVIKQPRSGFAAVCSALHRVVNACASAKAVFKYAKCTKPEVLLTEACSRSRVWREGKHVLNPVSIKVGAMVAASRHCAVSLHFHRPAATRPLVPNASFPLPRLPKPRPKGFKAFWVNSLATLPPPNPSFNRTCYGGRRKASLQHSVHCHKPALRHPP